tara:strand:- start:7128 stop:10280 length:3153 start_codon:yes stop_codon:yes gene_type:complete
MFFKRILPLVCIIQSILFGGVTGKVSGRVIDVSSGEPLIGANVMLLETTFGSATDTEGYYHILNVPPGFYDLKVNMIGYAQKTVTGIRVEIDLTAVIDVNLTVEAIEGQMITVQANQKLVKVDVASSQKSISSEQILEMPVSSVSEVVGLSAGVSGLSVRGGGNNETQFMVDGLVLNDERTSEPTTGIPLSAVQDISLQTGGFGAEYRNARSGVINVVTKEGSKDSYSGSISFRQSAPGQKHFGLSPYDAESFWFKPYLDNEVCWTGTNNGYWDEYEQRQYPSFDGWNSISEQTLTDDDPNNDLTPAGAQKLFSWEHRLNGAIESPDINIDAGFGGPVPFISSRFGDLRFYFSTLREQDMYLYEVSSPGLYRRSYLLKLTSDLSEMSKLVYSFYSGKMEGTTLSRGGGTSIMNDVWDLASQVNSSGFTMPWRLYTNEYWSPTEVNNQTHGLKYSRFLNNNSFYDITLKIDSKNYITGHGERRDTVATYSIFGSGDNEWVADEAPVGFFGGPLFSVEGRLAFGGAISTSRDSSKVNTFTIKGAYTKQVNNNHQLKTGGEFVMSKLDLKYGSQNEFLPSGNYWSLMDVNPYRLSFFIQDKLEYKGFVAIAGLNLDIINPNGSWYNVDVYEDDFFSSNYTSSAEDNFDKEELNPQISLSPRLAISHPITESSKLYFNYGHYQQMPVAQDLYRVRRGFSEEVLTIGDPSLPMANTIAYEIGYDQSFFDSYLIHLSAYYKDISDQQDYTRFISANSKVNYSKLTANSYEDIRGFEFEFSKVRGKWLTGFTNFEYRVNTSGYYGLGRYYENPSDQRNYELNNEKQSKPRPIPRIKSVLDFHTPLDFGPQIAGQYFLGDWHLNLIGRWSAGGWFTYNPNNVPGIEYNVQYKNNHNLDLKFSKIFQIGNINLKLYADIFNVLNTKTFSGYGFEDGFDYNYYMQSLHLPEKISSELGYNYFVGDDRPGDVRKEGTEFIPMEWVSDVMFIDNPSERPIYYDNASDSFKQWTEEGGWTSVNQSFYDQVIRNKQYIDMPNQLYYVFLNPRDLFIGINISYDF